MGAAHTSTYNPRAQFNARREQAPGVLEAVICRERWPPARRVAQAMAASERSAPECRMFLPQFSYSTRAEKSMLRWAHDLRLRARLEIQTASFFRAILRIRRKARANWSHASEDSIVASKSFDRRRARLIQPRVLSTTHLLGKTMKPLTVVSVRLTTVMVIRLAS